MTQGAARVTARNTGRGRGRHAFTLIELLVVIGIIGLLAAILMPSLAKAKELAKAATCLSNQHNLGIGIMLYATDNQNLYPVSYNYIDGNSSAGGYAHWSAALNPSDYEAAVNAGKYPKVSKMFICPSHTAGGWAPSNFTPGRIPDPPSGQATQTAGQDDRQVPRLSYVGNEIIMPRKKYSAAHDAASPPGTGNLRQVITEDVDGADNTILLAEFSDNPNCIYGNSVGGGAAYKSHRPTNGVKSDQPGGVFDGEGYPLGARVTKLTYDEAMTAINAVLADKNAAASNHHISYVNPAAHASGSNYVFADGHAGKVAFKDTFDPGMYMWGKKVYSCADRPRIRDLDDTAP